MKGKIIKLTKSSFVRNVMIMATGTAAAQAVAMALSPIITRLYGPEAFGLLGVFMAIVGILSPIAALTYPVAIVLPKSDGEAKGLIRLSICISIVSSGVLGLILLFFYQPVIKLFQLESISSFLFLIPFVVLISGFLQVAEQWLIRTKQFAITAKVTFLHSLISQGSIVGIGAFHPAASVLIVLTVLGQALKASMMVIGIRQSNKKQLDEIDKKNMTFKQIAKKYNDFPFYRAPEVFVNAISQGLPILLLASFFGPASAGFYSIGRTVLGIPSQLIGKSVGDVFYPRIAEASNSGENLTQLIKKATLVLMALGIAPFGIVIIFGPWLFGFVFGAEWVTAGEYARWISLWSFFVFINQPSVKSLPVLNAQAFQLKFTLLLLVIRITALSIGFYVFSNDLVAIAFYCGSSAILNLFLILMTIRKSDNYHNKLI